MPRRMKAAGQIHLLESARMLPDSGGDDAECWLAEDIAGVQQNIFYMHCALVSPSPPPRC
jgi:hypothetical protein